MTGFELAIFSAGLALSMTCQSPGATTIEKVPLPVTPPGNLSGTVVASTKDAESAPTLQAEEQPAPAAQLVDRLFEIARDWNLDGAVARIERALQVRLSGDENRWSGTSTRWPLTVAYHPQRADRRGTLHLSFTNVTGVDLAQMKRRFGAPATEFQSKESRVEFDGPAGVRVVAGLLGGLTPTSPVAWIRLEGPGPRPAPPKDLF